MGEGFETGAGNGLSAAFTDAVGATVELGQRVIDLVHLHPSLGREGKVALPVDSGGGPLAGLVVELDVPRLHLLGQLVGLRLQVGGLSQIGDALLQEQRPLLLEELAGAGTLQALGRRLGRLGLRGRLGRRLLRRR